MNESSDDQDRAGELLLVRLRIATELLGLAYTAYVIWILLVPEHRRKLITMRMLMGLHRAAATAASRTGRRAMALEARGFGKRYEIPYQLSLLREAAAELYDRLRYTA